MHWIIERDCANPYIEAIVGRKPFMTFWLCRAKTFRRKKDARMMARKLDLKNPTFRKVRINRKLKRLEFVN